MSSITFPAEFITINQFSQLIFRNNETTKAKIMDAIKRFKLVSLDEYKLPFNDDSTCFRVNLPAWERTNLALKLRLNEQLRFAESITVMPQKYKIIDNDGIVRQGITLIYHKHKKGVISTDIDYQNEYDEPVASTEPSDSK